MQFFTMSAAAAADAVRYYLIAELVSLSVKLTEIESDGDPRIIRRLQRRWEDVAKMIVADGGLVSLSGMNLSEGLPSILQRSS